MKTQFYDSTAPKKATNLSVNSDLLRQARDHRINLSKAFEQHLVDILMEKKRCHWREENRDAMESYNRRINAGGTFSDGLRMF